MKIYIVLIWFLLSGLYLAQDNSYFNKEKSSIDAYGSLVTKVSNINNYGAFLIGGRGGIILDKKLNLGAGLYGLASIVPMDVFDDTNQILGKDRLHFMYGGFEIEYMIKPKKKLHYSIYTLIGLGTISSRNNNRDYPNNFYDHNKLSNFFFLVEPELNVILKLTKFLHASVGVSYLKSFGADYQSIGDSSISGFNGVLSIHVKGI